jgi:hypothetical protein
MMNLRAVLITCSAVSLVAAHGVFWSPLSRAQIAQNNGWESDTTSIIAEPMPEVAPNRPYPGGRPWAEPGKSLSNVGPCGLKRYAQKTNFHQPGHGWGVNVTATYQAGDVIDVAWCVSDLADHGGLYSYRVCTDDALVARFTDPNHTPSDDEMASLEVCFAAGILSCADVPGQDCPVHPDCQSGWGCENSTAWFNCAGKDAGRCAAKGAPGKCNTHKGSGHLLTDKVKLPAGFRSNHTLLGFRWDCEDTPQLWVQCADIAIV